MMILYFPLESILGKLKGQVFILGPFRINISPNLDSSMRRADRLFQIVQILNGRRLCTGQQIAERLEVSVRTIYRDIQDLILSGVPIAGEAGVGYSLRAEYQTTAPGLTIEELNSLYFAVKLVSATSDNRMAEMVKSAVQKIAATIPESFQDAGAQLPFFVGPTRISRCVSTRLSLFRTAITEERRVAMSYTRADGEGSTRVIWPLGLYYSMPNWLIASYCELRQEYRSFRLDRLNSDPVIESSFRLEAEENQIDLDGFLLRACHEKVGLDPKLAIASGMIGQIDVYEDDSANDTA